MISLSTARSLHARIGGVNVGVSAPAPRQTHVDFRRTLDDVIVRQNQPLRIDDHAAAERRRHVVRIAQIELALQLRAASAAVSLGSISSLSGS